MGATYPDLVAWFRNQGSVVVAFSGGVDSSVLLAAAVDALGDRVLAVTCSSPLYPARELNEAKQLAAKLGARHLIVPGAELDSDEFRRNPPRRCYHCKTQVFSKLKDIASREGLATVVEGSNSSDLSDYRPGLEAVRELGVRSPFIELTITKDSIRQFARERGLPIWDKPSSACLASRIPYGEEITVERLGRIEKSEEALRSLGFRLVRVRDHGTLARIEIAREEIDRALQIGTRQLLVKACREQGYKYVCLDLEGYRTGAMNETLAAETKGQGG